MPDVAGPEVIRQDLAVSMSAEELSLCVHQLWQGSVWPPHQQELRGHGVQVCHNGGHIAQGLRFQDTLHFNEDSSEHFFGHGLGTHSSVEGSLNGANLSLPNSTEVQCCRGVEVKGNLRFLQAALAGWETNE